MFEYGQNFYILCFIECFLFFAVWMMGYWSPGVFPFSKEGKDQEEDFLKLPQKKISVDVKSKDEKWRNRVESHRNMGHDSCLTSHL